MSLFESGSTFCVITGASQGLGRCLSVSLASRLLPGSVMVLVARSGQGLEKTRLLALSEREADSIAVFCFATDLSEVKSAQIDAILSHESSCGERHRNALLINNAGSLGDIATKASANRSPDDLDRFWSLNLTSTLALTSAFLARFRESSDMRTTVVQISSRISERPTPGLSLYCAAKAARLMLFKVLALEEPEARFLSYGPGPSNTEMWRQLQSICVPEIKEMFAQMTARGQVRDPEEPVRHLLDILQADEFESGAHLLMPDRQVADDEGNEPV